MKESFLLSINAVVPMFLLVVTGYLLRRFGILKKEVIPPLNKLVFSVFLTSNLIKSLSSADLTAAFSAGLGVYIVLSHAVALGLMWLLVPRFLSSGPRAGSFIQCAYRSNCVLIGLSICINLFGDEGASVMALNLAIMVPFYNICSVILLTCFANRGEKVAIGTLAKGIATNPLILSCIIGILLSVFKIQLPDLIRQPIYDLAACSTPVAMLLIGAQFSFERALSDLKLVGAACALKLVALPAVFTGLAILLGFRGAELGVIFLFFAAPTAASGAIQAEAMGCDGEVAGEIQLSSTFLSVFTLFAGIFLLSVTGLI